MPQFILKIRAFEKYSHKTPHQSCIFRLYDPLKYSIFVHPLTNSSSFWYHFENLWKIYWTFYLISLFVPHLVQTMAADGTDCFGFNYCSCPSWKGHSSVYTIIHHLPWFTPMHQRRRLNPDIFPFLKSRGASPHCDTLKVHSFKFQWM